MLRTEYPSVTETLVAHKIGMAHGARAQLTARSMHPTLIRRLRAHERGRLVHGASAMLRIMRAIA